MLSVVEVLPVALVLGLIQVGRVKLLELSFVVTAAVVSIVAEVLHQLVLVLRALDCVEGSLGLFFIDGLDLALDVRANHLRICQLV